MNELYSILLRKLAGILVIILLFNFFFSFIYYKSIHPWEIDVVTLSSLDGQEDLEEVSSEIHSLLKEVQKEEIKKANQDISLIKRIVERFLFFKMDFKRRIFYVKGISLFVIFPNKENSKIPIIKFKQWEEESDLKKEYYKKKTPQKKPRDIFEWMLFKLTV